MSFPDATLGMILKAQAGARFTDIEGDVPKNKRKTSVASSLSASLKILTTAG